MRVHIYAGLEMERELELDTDSSDKTYRTKSLINLKCWMKKQKSISQGRSPYF